MVWLIIEWNTNIDILYIFWEARPLRKYEYSKLQVILLRCSKGKERIRIGHIDSLHVHYI